MDEKMIELLLTTIITIQSISIILGSMFVLQGVLNKCSSMLRLAFVVFPIAASIEFVDMLYNKNLHLSLVILNSAIMLILYWLWNQKQMFFDLEQLMRNKNHPTSYSFSAEIKAIVTCFAIWVLRKTNPKLQDRCVVCEQILPQ